MPRQSCCRPFLILTFRSFNSSFAAPSGLTPELPDCDSTPIAVQQTGANLAAHEI
jgi:hypothetical protein